MEASQGSCGGETMCVALLGCFTTFQAQLLVPSPSRCSGCFVEPLHMCESFNPRPYVAGLVPERRGPCPSLAITCWPDGFCTAVPFTRRDGASWQRRLRRLPAGRGHGGTCGCRAPGETRENLPLISLPLACTFPVRWFSLTLSFFPSLLV
jgi:hypothetical protein